MAFLHQLQHIRNHSPTKILNVLCRYGAQKESRPNYPQDHFSARKFPMSSIQLRNQLVESVSGCQRTGKPNPDAVALHWRFRAAFYRRILQALPKDISRLPVSRLIRLLHCLASRGNSTRFLHDGIKCCQKLSSNRPSVSKVVDMKCGPVHDERIQWHREQMGHPVRDKDGRRTIKHCKNSLCFVSPTRCYASICQLSKATTSENDVTK